MRPAPRAPAILDATNGCRSGTVRLRRRSNPVGSRAVSRRLGSEASGDSRDLRHHACGASTRRGRPGRESDRGGADRGIAMETRPHPCRRIRWPMGINRVPVPVQPGFRKTWRRQRSGAMRNLHRCGCDRRVRVPRSHARGGQSSRTLGRRWSALGDCVRVQIQHNRVRAGRSLRAARVATIHTEDDRRYGCRIRRTGGCACRVVCSRSRTPRFVRGDDHLQRQIFRGNVRGPVARDLVPAHLPNPSRAGGCVVAGRRRGLCRTAGCGTARARPARSSRLERIGLPHHCHQRQARSPPILRASRDLPQYFVQAAPALALAAAWGATFLRTSSRIANTIIACLIVIAIWRVNDFEKLVDNTGHDLRFMLGATTRSEHLARYGDRATRKYSALAMDELGAFMESHSTPADTVYVFGFSSGAYVKAGRAAASRFFWSRPVIVGFNQARPGYGVSGLLDDLRRGSPAIVALQQRDWYPDVDDSAHFFMTTPSLANWLRDSYQPASGPDGYDIWMKRASGR